MVAAARIALACLVLAAAIAAAPALAADFPIPPVPHTYVTDGTGSLSSATANALESELKSYEKQTGNQVIVWIGQTTSDVPLEDWTSTVAHAWGIGHKGKDDGVVLFVFMKDHRARIEVGYGLEGELPDAKASEIMRKVIVAKMKSGDVDAAVSGGVASILTTITPSFASDVPAEDLAASSNDDESSPAWVPFLIFGFIFGFWILIFVLRRFGKKGSGWGGGWIASSSGGSDFGGSSDFGGGDFSAGGGDFGGGGASGGW